MTDAAPMPPDATEGRLRFGPFVLEIAERRLLRDGAPVALQSRYFDLLACLTRHAGTLVRKDDLFEAVWPGVVVGDAALTQGIRAIRRALDDDAAHPQYVETVAGHGYRFVAPVDTTSGTVGTVPPHTAASASPGGSPDAPASPLGATFGAIGASLAGGLLYGATLGAGGPHPGSTMVSVAAMAVGAGGLGAAAVAFGATFAAARWGRWTALLGGGVAGALVGRLGEGAGRSMLMTLTGRTVGDLTGMAEGALLGAVLALAFVLRGRSARAVVVTAGAALVLFAGLAALGRPLFLGSLEQTLALPGVPLRLSLLAPGGPTDGLRVLLSALEGLLFGLGFAYGARHADP